MKIYIVLIYCFMVLAMTFYFNKVIEIDHSSVFKENSLGLPTEQTTKKAGFGNFTNITTFLQRNKLITKLFGENLVNQVVGKQDNVTHMLIKDKMDEEKDDGNMEENLDASGDYYERSQRNKRSVPVGIHQTINNEAKGQEPLRMAVTSQPNDFELEYKLRNKASKDCIAVLNESERILYILLPFKPFFQIFMALQAIMGVDPTAQGHLLYIYLCNMIYKIPYGNGTTIMWY